MWPYIIMAAATIGSAVISSNKDKANARSNSIATHYNARNTLETGIANANAITAAMQSNNAVLAALGIMGADDTWDIANYNADLRMLVGDYNAQLLEREAFDIWEAAELDVSQVDNQGKRLAGNILVAYGASGAQINETDSVADALIDAATQVELEKFIIRHGADINATKVMNEAARNRWDGYAAAKQLIFEGSKSSISQLATNATKIIGNTIQGQIDSSITYENAVRSMKNITMGGEAITSQYNTAASSAMASGLFEAGSQIASGYVKQANPGTPSGNTATVNTAKSYNSFNNMNNDSLITSRGSMSASLLTE